MYILGGNKHKKTIIISIGYDEFGEKNNEIYQYNFESDEWKRIVPTSGVVPGIFL